MPIALETVVKQISDSGIIAPGKLENFIPPKANPKDGEELLRELYKQSLVTKFQAQQIAAGKIKSLILGEYTILDRIGAGGMGQVFKAEHRRMKRKVAIKMLPPELTKDAATIARFQREVEAAAKLFHPNIVPALDAGQAGNAHFLVMEYVEGSDLSALVKKEGPFPVAKAVNYILQAARGLEFAHSEGVIHRDIKPANLLLDKKGVVKILDMGLARIDTSGNAATQAELTGSGTIMGTVDYMAPEQGMSTKHADARADIYSLGCSLYYLIAGKATYDGETMAAKLIAHHTHSIPALRAAHPDVPEPLEAIFKKMVAKRIEDRYQTMTEVIADLEKCGSGQPASVRSAEPAIVATAPSHEATAIFSGSTGATAHKSEPTRTMSLSGSGNGNKKFVYGVVGAALAGVLVMAGIIASLKTGSGKLTVEVNQPDALVQVLDEQGRVEITQKGGKDKIAISVDPGKHRLKVEKDGFIVYGKEFEMERGGRREIHAKLEAVHSESTLVSAPPLAIAPFDAVQAKGHQEAWAQYLGTQIETANSVGMRLALIPPGEFLMGFGDEQQALALKIAEEIKAVESTKKDIQKKHAKPLHRVTLPRPLWVGTTEVTVSQFRQFVEASQYVTQAEQENGKMTWKFPGYEITDDCPVSFLTWNEACRFCNWLSERENLLPCYRADGNKNFLLIAAANGYRLPTEAQWEYICRAGTETLFSFGDDIHKMTQYAWFHWFEGNSGGQIKPVGLKTPNAFGIFDMHGNVQEWCQDFYDESWYEKSPSNDPSGPATGSSHVLRGGSCVFQSIDCFSAVRSNYAPLGRYFPSGFRVVRLIDAPKVDPASATTSKPTTPSTKSKLAYLEPAFQAWVKEVQAMPAEEQIEAVSKKLVELNPGFDGKLTRTGPSQLPPKIENGAVTELIFVTNSVSDISPVRALPGLKVLYCVGNSGKGMLSDLSPLQGMSLNTLIFYDNMVSDLSPLQEMQLSSLNCNGTQVSDLSPLHDCKKLKSLIVTKTKVTAASVAALQEALPNCKIDWDDPAKPTSP